MKEWRNQKTFFRFLALFCIVISVPFVILGFIIDAYYLKYIEGDVVKQNAAVMEKAVSMFESEIAHLYNAAGEFDASYDFSAEGLKASAPLYEPVSAVIRSVSRTNGIIEDIVVYNYGLEDLVLTPKGTFNSYYYGSYIASRFQNRSTLVSAFFNEEYYLYGQSIPYSAESPYNTIDYIVALPKAGGIVSFRIRKTAIDNIFSLPLLSGQMRTFIFDERGQVFYVTGGTDPLDETGMSLLSTEQSSQVLEAGKNIYFKQVSEPSRFTYIGVLPQKVISEGVGYFKNIFLAASSLIVILGSGLIFLFARLNYRPIQKLYQSTLAKLDPNSIPGELDIMDKLQYAINTLDDTAKMRESMQLQIMKEHVLLKLFQGDYKKLEDFNRDGMEPGLYLPAAAYRVVAIRYSVLGRPDDVDALFQGLEEALSLQYEAYGLNNTEQGQFILLVCYAQDGQKPFEPAVELINSVLSTEQLTDVYLGIGNECGTVRDIRKSFLQAKNALDQAYAREKGVCYFQDLARGSELQYSSLRLELDNLYGAIISHNVVQVDFVLNTLVNLISEYHHSLFLAICLCGDIFSTAMKAMSQLDEEYGRLYYGQVKSFDVSRFHSVPELMNVVLDMKQGLVPLLEQYNRQSGSVEIPAVMTYIKENCTRYDLSVSSVADRFSMTPSNLSHQFKAQMGYNISDYINKEKMNHAKTLLAMTDLTIYEIAERVGYSQPSSFIRKFKQYENMTPREYKRRVLEMPEPQHKQ